MNFKNIFAAFFAASTVLSVAQADDFSVYSGTRRAGFYFSASTGKSFLPFVLGSELQLCGDASLKFRF